MHFIYLMEVKCHCHLVPLFLLSIVVVAAVVSVAVVVGECLDQQSNINVA